MWDLSSPNQNSKSEWVLNAVLYPGLDPGTERRYYWKIGEIQIKSKVQCPGIDRTVYPLHLCQVHILKL